jgi:hypothetical protein
MGWVHDDNFIKMFNTNNPKLPVVHDDDRSIVDIIEPDMEVGPWIAGGAVLNWFNNESIGSSDIDVFFNSQLQFDQAFGRLMAAKSNMVYNSDNAVTLHIHTSNGQMKRIQLIRKNWFQTAKEVIDRFDITVCQLATDGNQILLGEYTAEHIKQKRLEFTDKPVHADIVKRLVKYVTYGYTPNPALMQSILDNESNFNWSFNGTEADYDAAF